MSYPLFYYQQACSSAKPMQKINLATGAVDSEVFELMGRSLCLAARCARPFSRGISIEVDKRAPENQNTHTQRTKNSFYTTSKKQQSVSIWLRGNMFFFPRTAGHTNRAARPRRPQMTGLFELRPGTLGPGASWTEATEKGLYAICHLFDEVIEWLSWLVGWIKMIEHPWRCLCFEHQISFTNFPRWFCTI